MRLSRVYLGSICTLILVSLSGCGAFTKEKIVVKNVPVYVPVVCPEAQKVTSISPRPIKPKAIQDMAGIWWVALTPNDYENLAINTKETIRYIIDQRGVVAYYRECIITFNNSIDKLKNDADKMREAIDENSG